MCIYLCIVFAGPGFLRERGIDVRAYLPLKTFMTVWNAFLAVFSILGLSRIMPHLIGSLSTNGFRYT